MKKFRAIIALLWIFGSNVQAQQLPHYTNFTYNYLNYNPAVTGSTPCLEARVGYRKQWTGFQGAPTTGYVNVHNKFGQRRYNFHGLGVMVENDTYGPFGTTSLVANYAYHMKLTKGYSLSSGIGVGFSQYRLGLVGITMPDIEIDPVIGNSLGSIVAPTVNFGLWLYRKDRFYGLSVRQLTQPKVKGLPDTQMRRHYTLAYGKAVQLNDKFTFKPAALLNYVGNSKPSIEGQAMLDYKKVIAIGIAGRSGHGGSALVKLDALPYLTIAYAYDITANRLRYAATNSHEITLGFRACGLKERNHVPCAAYD
jgi:type IX secretion system PorP/SprF family membrane protein